MYIAADIHGELHEIELQQVEDPRFNGAVQLLQRLVIHPQQTVFEWNSDFGRLNRMVVECGWRAEGLKFPDAICPNEHLLVGKRGGLAVCRDLLVLNRLLHCFD